ncbi:hypothetical protein ACFR99_13625 [Haloarchaeobius amylolyticus]|uniref:Uncharacterized protein n=1 Tax=Haloarchaeobius amylolyticus TaxID=1198296 RepID=A0ABD6BHX2_9EURY
MTNIDPGLADYEIDRQTEDVLEETGDELTEGKVVVLDDSVE